MQEKSFKRAERRHHVNRLKNKRKYHYGYQKYLNDDNRGRMLGMIVNTATNCSCHMCGNPRSYYGNSSFSKTLSEQSDLEVSKLSD